MWVGRFGSKFSSSGQINEAVELQGSIMTDCLRELGAVAETLIVYVPAGGAGTPVEFGAACAFLCSEAAGFIVGQNLSIDGGLVRATI